MCARMISCTCATTVTVLKATHFARATTWQCLRLNAASRCALQNKEITVIGHFVFWPGARDCRRISKFDSSVAREESTRIKSKSSAVIICLRYYIFNGVFSYFLHRALPGGRVDLLRCALP